MCIFANGRNTNYIISHLSRVPALESSGSVFDNDINTISADKTFRTSILPKYHILSIAFDTVILLPALMSNIQYRNE